MLRKLSGHHLSWKQHNNFATFRNFVPKVFTIVLQSKMKTTKFGHRFYTQKMQKLRHFLICSKCAPMQWLNHYFAHEHQLFSYLLAHFNHVKKITHHNIFWDRITQEVHKFMCCLPKKYTKKCVNSQQNRPKFRGL